MTEHLAEYVALRDAARKLVDVAAWHDSETPMQVTNLIYDLETALLAAERIDEPCT